MDNKLGISIIIGTVIITALMLFPTASSYIPPTRAFHQIITTNENLTAKNSTGSLMLVEGSNIDIDLDYATDKVTISYTGSNASNYGEILASQWENDRTFTTIGTNFVDVYTATNANGEAVRIDTTDMNKVTLQILWSKLLGLGTQTCQIVDISNSTNILITSDSLADGVNIKAVQEIPTHLKNTIKNYKPQCKSTTGLDAPVWLGGQVLLKN